MPVPLPALSTEGFHPPNSLSTVNVSGVRIPSGEDTGWRSAFDFQTGGMILKVSGSGSLLTKWHLLIESYNRGHRNVN